MFFKPCGNIIQVKRMRDGKAFVKFDSKESFDKAIKLNGVILYDRKIFVEPARNNKTPNTPRV